MSLPPLAPTPVNSPRVTANEIHSPRVIPPHPPLPSDVPAFIVNTPRADAIGTPELPGAPLRSLGSVCKGCRSLEKRVRALEELIKKFEHNESSRT